MFFKRLFIGLSVLCVTGIGVYVFNPFHVQRSHIEDFQEARDLSEVVSLFEKDYYWLSASENYDVATAFKTKSPGENSPYKGLMQIKVIRDDNQLAGFVTYYKTKPTEGKILFLEVAPAFRSKGYGAQLMEHALRDLYSQGCTVVRLLTRTCNHPAQRLYKRLGFHETSRDDGFVYFARPR